jgi:hypothetical protein
LEEDLKLLEDKEVLTVVLCGESQEHCNSIGILNAAGFTQVVPLSSCPEIANEFSEGALDRMVECEKKMYKMIMDSTQNGKKIGSIILDQTCPLALSRIVYKILKTKGFKVMLKNLFVWAVMFEQKDTWRRNFLERFRKDVVLYDPNYRAEVLFNTTDASMELGVTLSGDEGFVNKFKTIVSAIEVKTGLVSDIRDIKGGLFAFDENWKPSHFFLPEDYDQRSPFEQWKSQKPVGYQTVSQFEPKSDKTMVSLSSKILKAALLQTTKTLHEEEFEESKGMDKAEITEVESIGDGYLLMATWSVGNCVLLWDGRRHVDLNLFTYNENEEFSNDFSSVFKAQFGKVFITALRDDQPRGYGRVVSFQDDIEDIGPHPHWAKFK